MRTIRLKGNTIQYYVLFLLITFKYLLPPYLNSFVEQTTILDMVLTMLPVGLIALFFILKNRVPKASLLLIIAIYASLLFSTAKNGGNLVNSGLHSVYVLMICLLLDVINENDIMLESFLAAVRDITFFFCLANSLVMIILPEGIPSISEGKLYPCFLYGNVNATIKYIIPGIGCSLILDRRHRRKASFSTIFLIASVIVSAVMVYFTATAVIADLFIVMWMLGEKWIRKRAWRKYAAVLFVVCLFEFLVVFGTGGSVFVSLITKVLHKSITFSGRAPLWKRTFNLFVKKPLFGYGFKPYADLEKAIHNGYGCHNYYLDILYQRGLVGMGIILIMIVVPVCRGWNKEVTSPSLYVLLGVASAYALMLLMEPFYDTEYIFIPVFYALFFSFSVNKKKMGKNPRLQKLYGGGYYERETESDP